MRIDAYTHIVQIMQIIHANHTYAKYINTQTFTHILVIHRAYSVYVCKDMHTHIYRGLDAFQKPRDMFGLCKFCFDVTFVSFIAM